MQLLTLLFYSAASTPHPPQLEACQRSLASKEAALAAATATADELRSQIAAAHAERRDSEASVARTRDGLERREAQLQRIADLYRASSEAATGRVGERG